MTVYSGVKMSKNIRVEDETYEKLSKIKEKIEERAGAIDDVKVTMTFDQLLNKLCDIYEEASP